MNIKLSQTYSFCQIGERKNKWRANYVLRYPPAYSCNRHDNFRQHAAQKQKDRQMREA